MTNQTATQKRIKPAAISQREACLKHAKDLLDSAKRVMGGNGDFANIAYHLSILSLEEIGKAGMIIARAVSEGSKNTDWITKRLDDHAFKLMWAVWSPRMLNGRIDPKKFEDARQFAKETHARRLDALYVDHDVESERLLRPDEVVTAERAVALLDLATACLEYESERDVVNIPEEDDLLEWFLKTSSDIDGSARLFSKPFINKLEEFGDDVRAWIDWAKRRFEEIQEEDSRLIITEMSKKTPGDGTGRERWILKIRLVSLWHTFQPKVLKIWSKALPNAKLEVRKGSNNRELTLTIRLTDDVPAAEVFEAGLMQSKMLITALNIGGGGYIWYDISDQSQSYFEKIEDLENPNHRLQIQKPVGASSLRLKVLDDGEWRTSEVFHATYLQNSMNCIFAFFGMPENDAEPIFGPYMTGCALLSMTNLHVSCDDQALNSFKTCLSKALARFSGCDGSEKSKRSKLHEALSQAIDLEEHRNSLIDWNLHEGQKDENKIRTAFSLKRLVDLYMSIIARRICDDHYRSFGDDKDQSK